MNSNFLAYDIFCTLPDIEEVYDQKIERKDK